MRHSVRREFVQAQQMDRRGFVHANRATEGQHLLRSEQVEPLLTMAAEASVSRALAARGVDAVLRSDRQAIARDVEHDLQTAADRYPLGVTILGVSLTDARPPTEVEADFAAAQSAESQRDRRINEAKRTSRHEACRNRSCRIRSNPRSPGRRIDWV